MAANEKIDLYKLHKDEYASPRKPCLVDVKKAKYLAISGKGAPGGEAFQAKIGALYGAAYTIKMTRKFSGRQDYVVCKLEAQWWSDDEGVNFADLPKEEWCWTLMIRTPNFVKNEELDQAKSVLLEKGKGEEVRELEFLTMSEGSCVQMLHVGPYEKEDETIALMREFAHQEGLTPHGRHHEIYISDPRRVPPERLKTILRMPVRS